MNNIFLDYLLKEAIAYPDKDLKCFESNSRVFDRKI